MWFVSFMDLPPTSPLDDIPTLPNLPLDDPPTPPTPPLNDLLFIIEADGHNPDPNLPKTLTEEEVQHLRGKDLLELMKKRGIRGGCAMNLPERKEALLRWDGTVSPIYFWDLP